MKRIPWLVLLFFALVLYFIFFIRKDIIDYLDLRKEEERVSEKMEAAQQLFLKSKGKLNQDNDRVEELARTRLGLIKKGEIAYKVYH
jgi:cell division protein FtsB